MSLDLSGEGLHRRGYRLEGGEAPLKENLAAAILLRAGWPAVAAQGGALLDPMCGSGTLLVEGALMAADIAPGLLREYYGFLGWEGFEPGVWQQLLAEAARAAARRVLPSSPASSGPTAMCARSAPPAPTPAGRDWRGASSSKCVISQRSPLPPGLRRAWWSPIRLMASGSGTCRSWPGCTRPWAKGSRSRSPDGRRRCSPRTPT